MSPAPRKTPLLDLAKMATGEPLMDEESSRSATCLRCRGSFHIDFALEPCTLCNTCAIDASRELGDAIVTLYRYLATLPALISEPIRMAIETRAVDVAAFIEEVKQRTMGSVLPSGRRRRK